jgi:hypothetical protein
VQRTAALAKLLVGHCPAGKTLLPAQSARAGLKIFFAPKMQPKLWQKNFHCAICIASGTLKRTRGQHNSGSHMAGKYYDDEVRKPALGEAKHRPRSKVRSHGMRGQGVRRRGIGCWRYTSCILEIWIFVGEQAGWESSRVSSLDFSLSLLCSASLLCRTRTLFRLRSISSTRCSQAGSWKLRSRKFSHSSGDFSSHV